MFKKFDTLNKAEYLFFTIWALFQLWYSSIGIIGGYEFRFIYSIFLLISALLMLKNTKYGIKATLIFDIVIIMAYMYYRYTKYLAGDFSINSFTIVAGLGISLIILYIGYSINKAITILTIFFIIYLIFGQYLPYPLFHSEISAKRFISMLFMGTQGLFGISTSVAASYIFLFIILGTFLKYTGFTDYINELSFAIIGESIGGPAKVAVVSSAIMGMINGSAVANVATTGVITIPMMKKSGYSKEFAGAVEAVASTGGQFCPPVMGAVGFVMAEFLQIPYSKVVLAAILPAFLYYLGLLYAVHLEAKKNNLKGYKSNKSLISLLKSRNIILLIPLIALIWLVAKDYNVKHAAIISIGLAILANRLSTYPKMGIKKIIEALVKGSVDSIAVGICCLVISIIIGIATLTGVSLNIGFYVISAFNNTNIYLIGAITALISIVLGMGIPGIAAYIMVQAIACPILINNGVSPIAANLFCLIYACLSNITPPVAISSYIASTIAKGNMFKTSLIAVKLGIIGFIVPFFFLRYDKILLGVSNIPYCDYILSTLLFSLLTIYLVYILSGIWLTRLIKLHKIN